MTYWWSPASLLQGLVRSPASEVGVRADAVTNFDTAPPSPYLEKLVGIKPHVSFVEAHGGVKLRVAHFEPPEKPVFTLLLAPGQNSPIEFFRRLATVTALLGARTFVYDPRSQGFSGRTTKKIQRIDTLHKDDHIRDMRLVTDKVVLPNRVGEFRIAGFSMGGLNLLLGLARTEILADRAIAVAPAILPLDLPHGRLSGPLKEAWIKGSKITRADRGIKYVNDWDYSQLPPTDEWLDKNAYARNPPVVKQAWQMLQHPGDMLRPGLPTARRVAHLFDSTREANALPANSIKVPLSLIQAKDDIVICNDTAHAVCSRVAKNTTTIALPEPHTLELAPPAAIKAIAQEIAADLVSYPRRGAQSWGSSHARQSGYTPFESHPRSERRAKPGLAA